MAVPILTNRVPAAAAANTVNASGPAPVVSHTIGTPAASTSAIVRKMVSAVGLWIATPT
jgi:hypothetical protein